jgi:hypothetical protein
MNLWTWRAALEPAVFSPWADSFTAPGFSRYIVVWRVSRRPRYVCGVLDHFRHDYGSGIVVSLVRSRQDVATRPRTMQYKFRCHSCTFMMFRYILIVKYSPALFCVRGFIMPGPPRQVHHDMSARTGPPGHCCQDTSVMTGPPGHVRQHRSVRNGPPGDVRQ